MGGVEKSGPTLFGLLLLAASKLSWGSDLAGQEHTSTSRLLGCSDDNTTSESRPIGLKLLPLSLLQWRPSRRRNTQRPIVGVPDPVLDHQMLESLVRLRLSYRRREVVLQNLLLSQPLKLQPKIGENLGTEAEMAKVLFREVEFFLPASASGKATAVGAGGSTRNQRQ